MINIEVKDNKIIDEVEVFKYSDDIFVAEIKTDTAGWEEFTVCEISKHSNGKTTHRGIHFLGKDYNPLGSVLFSSDVIDIYKFSYDIIRDEIFLRAIFIKLDAWEKMPVVSNWSK